jgi:hypothetical protein
MAPRKASATGKSNQLENRPAVTAHPLRTAVQRVAPPQEFVGKPNSEFAKGYRDWTGGCADGRKEAAEDAHYQGEKDSQQQEIQGDFEGERNVRKGLKIHGVGGPAIERQHHETAKDAAGEGNEQGFKKK